MVIAHEIGHFHLHVDPHNEVTGRPQTLGGDPIDSGAGRSKGIPAGTQRGTSRHLCRRIPLPFRLAPRSVHPWQKAPERDCGRTRIARRSGIESDDPGVASAATSPRRGRSAGLRRDIGRQPDGGRDLEKGALLVDAGPGTGKTRTLVKRIRYLLDRGSAASSFLPSPSRIRRRRKCANGSPQ